MRRAVLTLCAASLCAAPLAAQADSARNKTFFTRHDLLPAGLALAGSIGLSHFDPRIARWSQARHGTDSLRTFSSRASKVNETTLTAAGIIVYGVGRLTKNRTIADIALHSTESVVLASVASQLIRGPLGRSRPYVTHDSDQYDFKAFGGFRSFDNRAFPSIHMSSSMAVATVLAMESHYRHPGATRIVAPLLYGAALIPGLARIDLNQHWASDIASGAFMGIFSAYKVVSYSHAHPDNRFDRMLLMASVMPAENGRWIVSVSPSF